MLLRVRRSSGQHLGIESVRDELVAGSREFVGQFRLQQGFVENSNVNPMQEMVQLLQSVRHMETLQKVATSYDEMLGTSIRKLGENA